MSMWRYFGVAAHAYFALARGDSSAALRLFLSLSDSLGFTSDIERLRTARLLAARHEYERAAELLHRDLERDPSVPGVLEPLLALERARVYDRLGDRGEAVESYRFVAAVWRNADPELRPFVEEARTALKRLGGESPR
jgi:tetratricopeptide (TPR) repeat protein